MAEQNRIDISKLPESKRYTLCEEKEADAIGWAFTDEKTMVKYPFKFPPLSSDEIRANILFTGLCMSDVYTVRHLWATCDYPVVPGHEIVAQISKVGDAVKDFKVGDVIGFGTRRSCCEECEFCCARRENLCNKIVKTYGNFYWGGYATAFQAKASWCFKLPPNFDIQKGSPLLCAGTTTFSPIEKYLTILSAPKKTGVVGCGGIGHMAIQFLHKLGHHVTAFTTSSNKNEVLKKLGVDKIVLSTDEKQLKEAYNTVDFLICCINVNAGVENYFHVLKKGGKFIQLGLPPQKADCVKIDLLDLVSKEIQIIGSIVGTREVTNKMLKFCTENNIYPLVEEYSFEDFPKAFERLEHGRPLFRCVVNVRDYAKKHGLFK